VDVDVDEDVDEDVDDDDDGDDDNDDDDDYDDDDDCEKGNEVNIEKTRVNIKHRKSGPKMKLNAHSESSDDVMDKL